MTENGIAVWSVKDGECSNRTPTERLLVYLAGWRASCESERLGERVCECQRIFEPRANEYLSQFC